MSDRTYTVTGMTCTHCVASVREQIAELEGVEVAELELESGRLVVRGTTSDVADDAIRAAVEEAGYRVAPA